MEVFQAKALHPQHRFCTSHSLLSDGNWVERSGSSTGYGHAEVLPGTVVSYVVKLLSRIE